MKALQNVAGPFLCFIRFQFHNTAKSPSLCIKKYYCYEKLCCNACIAVIRVIFLLKGRPF